MGGKFGFLCPFYGFFLQNDAHRKRLLDFGASRRLGMGDIFVFLVSSEHDGDERSDVGNVDYIVVVDVAMFYGIAC